MAPLKADGRFSNKVQSVILMLCHFLHCFDMSSCEKRPSSIIRTAQAFEAFLKSQSFSGILLVVCTLIALVVANSGWSKHYFHINHVVLGLKVGDLHAALSWKHWVNDGLMAIFFLLVGLEIKREIVVGELSDFSKAILPIAAAIGGMVMPALIFSAINLLAPSHSASALKGWGIPMATDIAFALGVLALMGKRVPKSLVIFLSAVAIVDDLGGVVVIALFYTQKIHLAYIGWAFACLVVLILLNCLRVYKLFPYLLMGALLWFCLLNSGVHATIAGVVLAFCIPGKFNFNEKNLFAYLENLYTHIDKAKITDQGYIAKADRKQILHTLESVALEIEPPLQRLEHALNGPVTYLIIPLFVLFNAGIHFGGLDLNVALTHPVTVGIIMGLVVGKVLGIFGASCGLVKSGWAKLPPNTSLKLLFPVSILGGIGFTMSIFIAELAYPYSSQFLVLAKTGILIASLIAGLTGFGLLSYYLKKPAHKNAV